eukprot:4909434-Prymnesium_polylepis.3
MQPRARLPAVASPASRTPATRWPLAGLSDVPQEVQADAPTLTSEWADASSAAVSSAALPQELLKAAHAAEGTVGVAVLGAGWALQPRGARAADDAERVADGSDFAAARHPLHASAHPSGTLLVEDRPAAFARAALDALRDGALWAALSRAGLRHQRMLSAARQSGVMGEALRDGLQLDSPAEQACVIVLEPSDAPRLRAPLAAMLRLRVAVHVLLWPAAPADAENSLLGWARAQGVFTYAGSARE